MDGAGTDQPQWDPAIGMLHQLFAAMETAQPYGIGAYIAYRHDPLTGMPDPEAHEARAGQAEAARLDRRALFGDGLVLRRHPARVDLPRARQHPGQMHGPVPVFAMRDQAIAPRFDSRPAWWIFREILRRMDIKEALDFETIEELWNYQLDGTGVTVAEMRESGFVGLAAAPKLTPRDELKFPTPSGKIEIESDVLKKAGLPSLPPYEPKAAPTGDRFTCCSRGRRRWRTASPSTTRSSTRSRRNRCSGSIPTAPSRWASRDGDEVEISGGGRYVGRLKAKVTPWIHPEAVFMLHGYGATVPLATRALGLGVADQRLQHGKLYDFDPAGGGCALTETIVRVKPAAAGGARP